MKRILTVGIAWFIVAMNTMAQTRTLFDIGWQFTRNGKTINVDLPHDWDIYTAPDPKTGATGTGGGWYPGGKGEYRKTFKTPKGELTKLHFEGVYQKAEVYVNGQKAGQHAYGYTPFTVDITPYLYNKGRDNEVVVKVDNSEQPNCRWYSGSGIYRHVWLQTLPALHIKENGVIVTTPKVTERQAVVNVEVTIQNESNSDQKAVVAVDYLQHKPITLKAGECKAVTFSFGIDNPKLWSPDTPHLYETIVELYSDLGPIIAHNAVHFGIRSFSFDAEKGFLLNDKPLLINGACVHHDDGVLGAMAFDAAEVRKVRQMKEAGLNLIRTAHNPTARGSLDA